MTAARKLDKQEFADAKKKAEAAKPKGPPRPAFEDLIKRTEILQTQTFAPLKWIVPNVLPEGLSMLGGRPKVGKSWAALDIATSVASGGECLGEQCEQGDVLGLFLEDHDRRMQQRMTKMLGAQKKKWPGFDYATQWPRLHQDGIEFMKRWIDGAKKPRLIIVDILQRVRQPAGRSTDSKYEADYEALASMQALAGEAQLSIMTLHHQRKMGADDLIDTMSGTLGLTGGLDHLLVLGKEQDGSRFLWGNGRESEEFKLAVQFDEHMRLENLGVKIKDASTAERAAIITVLAKSGSPMSIESITKAVGGKRDNVKQLLSKMCTAGVIERETMGVYRLPKTQADLAGII
jgi:AAA domain